MSDPKKMEITCPKCGKEFEVTVGKGHTSVVKCECGAEVSLTGEPGPILRELNDLLCKVPVLLEQFKAARRRGVETGIDEGLHEATKKVTLEILEEDEQLKNALRELVRKSLRKEEEPGE